MLRNNTVAKIVSLIFAIALWVYIIAEVDPVTEKTLRNIPIQIVNQSILEGRGLVVQETGLLRANVTVSGKRSNIRKVDEEKISAKIDAADLHEGSNILKIDTDVPQTVSVVSTDPSSLEFKVERWVLEEKEIRVFLSDDSQLEPEDGILELAPDEVTVSGAESAVARVAYIQVKLEADQLTEELQTFELQAVPMDKNDKRVKTVDLSTDTIKVNVSQSAAENTEKSEDK